jgi:hypothetical protein
MNSSIQLKTPTRFKRNSIRRIVLITLLLTCFALSQTAQAVNPPPDGGYPGNNTAEGTNALLSLTSGANNTAVGTNALLHDTSGGYNVGVGSQALALNSTGNFNMAIGTQALYNNTASANMAVGFRVLFNNTTGNNLTGIGTGALFSNTTGNENTAIGSGALLSNTTGDLNTAVGQQALQFNTTGGYNTANGVQALFHNTTGYYNTASGYQALLNNTIGYNNTANAFRALYSNTTGSSNTAVGDFALTNNTTGQVNTAIGENALVANTEGSFNTANGPQALYSNTTGSHNTANGFSALYNNTGDGNTAVGFEAGVGVTAADNVICIGAIGANVSNSCFIGNIYGVSEGGTISPVYVNSDGQLGTQAPSSSRRFKKEIKAMDRASAAILSLKPVTFHYKSDNASTPQFGLIAEEVAEVNPDLVVHDENGDIYTVRYEAVNAMLLNEFLKEHRKVQEQGRKAEEQEATIARLKKDFGATVAQLTARLDEQASQIQKVSAQLAVSKPAPQVVRTNQ